MDKTIFTIIGALLISPAIILYPTYLVRQKRHNTQGIEYGILLSIVVAWVWIMSGFIAGVYRG